MKTPAVAVALALAACAVQGHRATGPCCVLRDLQGNEHRPLEVGASPGVVAHVLVFTTTDCPIANGYAPEIAALVAEHRADPLRFFLVHVDPDVTADRARHHAEEYGLHLPVLLDREHRLVAATGVTVTPEVAVLTATGMPYRGRIDDRHPALGIRRPAPRHHDLRDALRAVLDGRPVAHPRTEAVGCYVPERF